MDWTSPSYVFTHDSPNGGEAMRHIDAFTLPEGSTLGDVLNIGHAWIAEVHAYEDRCQPRHDGEQG